MKKVFNIGGVSYNSIIHLDEFPEPVPTTIHHCKFKEAVANTGAGKAVSLCKLDFDVTFHSLIGRDSYGEEIINYLDQPQLNFIYDIDPQGTERHLNIMNQKGERISIFMNPMSDTPDIDYDKFSDELNSSDIVVVNISNYCRNILPLCNEVGVEVWTDLHDYDGTSGYHQDFINASDYIFLSSDNLKDYKPFMESMILQGKKIVVCTHGKDGASVITPDGWMDIPIIDKYVMKDTNGAGDAFFSGFVYGHSKEYSIRKCMQLATISAGLCIQSDEIANHDLSAKRIDQEYQKYFS
ncbi:carbohydrate kinase family protein [Aquimarina sp. MMG016]|uniref:carbohydrate kinase family protein n=1 Tax=Aquimarina sp. MMG016 TaxID=2822690 RepID=UPI001B3A5FB9|nr:carbohydrate kinase family protein [Aquimarina sp. MMG016]MBQ4821951.1 carbohydrate kinase family protein [Aquimarina sp. MMG016]